MVAPYSNTAFTTSTADNSTAPYCYTAHVSICSSTVAIHLTADTTSFEDSLRRAMRAVDAFVDQQLPPDDSKLEPPPYTRRIPFPAPLSDPHPRQHPRAHNLTLPQCLTERHAVRPRAPPDYPPFPRGARVDR